jgi:hypothetical protein
LRIIFNEVHYDLCRLINNEILCEGTFCRRGDLAGIEEYGWITLTWILTKQGLKMGGGWYRFRIVSVRHCLSVGFGGSGVERLGFYDQRVWFLFCCNYHS